MRLRAKVDANHAEIVEELRRAGASVQSLAQIGHGVPDILVGWRGKNAIMEIKDPDKPKSARALTIDEKAWHFTWRGQVGVVETIEDALKILESL